MIALVLGFLITSLLLFSNAAFAQDGGVDPFAGVEEMIVVGSAGGEALNDLSVSVASFDEDYIDALGASDLKDIAQFTPNLEIRSPFAASNPTLFIRGVGLRDINANSSSSVAVYNDEVYMNSPSGQLAQLFDVETIEVLRGPQGVLYGRNASAGAIRVISKKPTNEFQAKLKTTYGRFNEVSVETAVQAPITEDLSIRVSATYNIRDGTTRNRCADRSAWEGASRTPNSRRFEFASAVFDQCFNADTVNSFDKGGLQWNAGFPGETGINVLRRPNGSPQRIGSARLAEVPPGIDKDVNNRDNWAARALIRYQPTDEIDFLFNIHGGQNRGQSRQFQGVGRFEVFGSGALSAPQVDGYLYYDPDQLLGRDRGELFLDGDPTGGDPYEGDYNNTGPENLDLIGSSLTGNITSGDFHYQTVTAWEYNSRRVDTNLDGGPFIGVEVDFGNRAWQVSQELKLDWDDGGPFKVQAGAYYLFENLKVDNAFRVSRTGAVLQFYEQQTHAGALYGLLTWELSELLEVEGGIRWNFETKDFFINSGPAASQTPPFGTLQPPPFSASRNSKVDENAPTGSIKLTYSPLSDIHFYIKFSRGWKGAHINGGAIGNNNSAGDAAADALTDPVRPEEVNVVELGTNADLWENRFNLKVAGFYYDYKNLQIFQLKNESGGVPVQTLLNANDADLFGVEIDVTLTPLEGYVHPAIEGLQIFGSFAWLESKYTDFTNTKINAAGAIAIPIVEDFSGNRLINSPEFSFAGYVQWPIGLGPLGGIGPRLDFTFKDRVFFNQNNDEFLSQDPLWLLNLRLDYRTPDDTIQVSGWVRNVTDEVYVADAINLSSFASKVLYAIGDPRTYGFTVTLTY